MRDASQYRPAAEPLRRAQLRLLPEPITAAVIESILAVAHGQQPACDQVTYAVDAVPERLRADVPSRGVQGAALRQFLQLRAAVPVPPPAPGGPQVLRVRGVLPVRHQHPQDQALSAQRYSMP